MKTEHCDILVVGAGSSGLCAAITAARLGKNVLLVESSSTLGGTNTLSLVGPLMGFHSGEVQVVKGLAQEIVTELKKRGGTLGHINDPLGVCSTITPVDSKCLIQVYFDLCQREENLNILFQCSLTGVVLDNGRVLKAVVTSAGGSFEVEADVFIDASGDGDLAALAGCRYCIGRSSDNLSQPMTQIFSVAGVDFSKVREYMKAYPDQFILRKGALDDSYTAVSGYFNVVSEARAAGDFPLDRDRVLLFQGLREDEALINMSRVCGLSSLDLGQMSAAQRLGHRQIDLIMSFLRGYIDGFQNIRLLDIGQSIGVRESRHVCGLYTLTENDILGNACFDDSVAMGAFPIDIHDPWGKELFWEDAGPVRYEIPYRVMLVPALDNLLVTGRCISATHVASASARITPTAMALGQAAGAAASIAEGGCVRDVDSKKLQKLLASIGAVPGSEYLQRL